MIKIICLSYLLLLHMILIINETPTHKIETDNVIAAIQQTAQNPTKPGAINEIVSLYEKLKDLAPDVATNLSSYIDRLKSIFTSDQDKQEPSPKAIVDPQNINQSNTQEKPPTTPIIKNEQTIKEEVLGKLDKTAQAIKEAAAASTKTVLQKGQELCDKLPTVNLKDAKDTAIKKAREIQESCATLSSKLTKTLTKEKKETIEKQTTAMSNDIEMELKNDPNIDHHKVQILCESMKQAANNFKEEAEKQWSSIKNTCTTFLSKPVENKPDKAVDKKTQPDAFTNTSNTTTPNTQPSNNPFFNIEPKTDKGPEKEPASTKNPFDPAANPFIQISKDSNMPKEEKNVISKESMMLAEKKIVIPTDALSNNPFIIKDKQPIKASEKRAPESKKAEEKVKDDPALLVSNRLADLVNTIPILENKEMTFNGQQLTYLINDELLQSMRSVYDLYKKLSVENKKIVNRSYIFVMGEYTKLLIKQINAIIPFVKESLEKRINYLVLWLDINANLACEDSSPQEKEQTLSFNNIGGWFTSKAKNAAETINKQTEVIKKQAATIICRDDELLFTQKDTEWQAVTTKAHVEKMAQEYKNSINIIQKGIAEPLAVLTITENTPDISQGQLSKIKDSCKQLIDITEASIDLKKDIKKSKEEFFKDNGFLTTLYNLWARYLNKYIVKKSRSTWTKEQKDTFDTFNKSYFIPLHETIKQLIPASTQEKILKKIVTEVDHYITNKD